MNSEGYGIKHFYDVNTEQVHAMDLRPGDMCVFTAYPEGNAVPDLNLVISVLGSMITESKILHITFLAADGTGFWERRSGPATTFWRLKQ
jgi:hypothetical protein